MILESSLLLRCRSPRSGPRQRHHSATVQVRSCRLAHLCTVNNIYHMSRLWRDTVTAALGDKSLCFAGSTGYSDSTKPAPEPKFMAQCDVDLDFGESYAALTTDGLDLSGGADASPLGAKSYTVTRCNTDGSCGGFINKICESLQIHPYSNLAGPLVDDFACVPHTSVRSYCPPDTQWVETSSPNGRLNPTKASQKLARSGSSSATKDGGYYPTTQFTDACSR